MLNKTTSEAVYTKEPMAAFLVVALRVSNRPTGAAM